MNRSRALLWLVPIAHLAVACSKPPPPQPAPAAAVIPADELADAARLVAGARASLAGHDHAEALRQATRASEIRRRLLGDAHVDTWSAVELLASVYLRRGDPASAEATVRWELSARERALGATSPLLAGTLGRLAEILEKRSDYPGAEQARRRALAVVEGTRAEDIAIASTSLAKLLVTLCRPAEAEPLLRRALENAERTSAADPGAAPERRGVSAEAWRELSKVRWLAGDDAGARTSVEEAIALLARAPGQEDVEPLLSALDEQARMLATRGLAAEERQVRLRAMEIGERHAPRFQLAWMNAAQDLWTSHQAANDAASAQALLARLALARVERVRSGAPPAPIAPGKAARSCDVPGAPRKGHVSNASAVVAGLAPPFRTCYDRVLKQDPMVTGSLRVTARVGPSGEVQGVVTFAPLGAMLSLAECVLDAALQAQFAPPEGGSATIVIPATFVSR